MNWVARCSWLRTGPELSAALLVLGSACGNAEPSAKGPAAAAGAAGVTSGAGAPGGLVAGGGGALGGAGFTGAGVGGSAEAGAASAGADSGMGGIGNGGGAGGMAAGRGGGGGSSTGGVGAAAGATAVGGALGSGGASGVAGSVGTATLEPDALVITGVRGVSSPAATVSALVHNAGTAALSVTALNLGGKDASLFQFTSPPSLPVSVPAGGELNVTLALLTSSSALPAAPPQDSGATALTATLQVTLDNGSVERAVSGLVLTTATHEPTLGQILDTLGYVDNVGKAQNDANPNAGGADTLPGIEPNTDEISAPLFQKAGADDVTLTAVARFSPKGPMPFGWYPKGAPDTRNLAGTMAQMTDAQTSDKARMVLPPITGGTAFDPGTQTFGVWVYSDQASQKYDTGGTATNGDYDYSEDALNSPAGVHRTRVYPLKTTGGTVPNSFLLAVEEAANGDAQDYVFVLANAKVAE